MEFPNHLQRQNQYNKIGQDPCNSNRQGKDHRIETSGLQIEIPHRGNRITLERRDKNAGDTPCGYNPTHYYRNYPKCSSSEEAPVEQEDGYLGKGHCEEI